ncbi:MAG: putative oxidoreductase YcjS [Firmicutes bacterium ADurb.Bin300]|jgi:predicted dehydrogenase|nr:MAG: putative oxidoreductase YcjS [Firmicutes bacterium ADurb.Bin300]
MSKSPLKVAVVGMGGIGNTHAKCYKEDELAQLLCVCDLRKDRADEAAEKYGVEAFYSLKEMLDAHPELDIIDVTTSGLENGSWHYEPVMQALDAGKHVLTEKPISNNILEAREMVSFAAKKNLYLGCNLNHFFSGPADKAREYIASGKIGEQIYCINKVGFNGSTVTPCEINKNSRWQMPYSHAKAFLTHPFSVMHHFCGEISHIQAFMDRPGARKQSGDLMLSVQSIHMKFQNGCVGYLLSQRGDACFGLGGWWSFELAGTKGTFCIENCVEKITYWEHEEEPQIMNTGITDFGATFPIRIHAFLEDITNNVPREHIRASGRDALATMEYIFAAIDSFESGGEIARPHALPAYHGDVSIIK